MAPTFYHHWPEPVTEKSASMEQSQWWGWKWLSIGLTLLAPALFVALIVFAVRANSKACKEGLLAEQECRNVTRLLELQLAQTRQHLLGAKDEAATCNQTVVRDQQPPERARWLRGPRRSRWGWRNFLWAPASGVGFSR